MSDSKSHGQWHYGIVTRNGETVYLFADRIEISGGCLIAWGHFNELDEDDAEAPRLGSPELHVNLALAPGEWVRVFAANVETGTPVAIEQGE